MASASDGRQGGCQYILCVKVKTCHPEILLSGAVDVFVRISKQDCFSY